MRELPWIDPELINDLQTRGMRLVDPRAGHESRRGGAGPSDHKAVNFGDTTVMVRYIPRRHSTVPISWKLPTPTAVRASPGKDPKLPEFDFPIGRDFTI